MSSQTARRSGRRRGATGPAVRWLAMWLVGAVGVAGAEVAQGPDLEAELAALRIPPPWLAGVRLDYDLNKPWKEARLHVRKLLDQRDNQQAIAITYDYVVSRQATPDDHEYGLYLYLGCEWPWAVKVYRDRLAAKPEHETMEYLNLASLYQHYGRTEAAMALLRQGLEHLPKAPWDVPNAAKLEERIGDALAQTDHREEALANYARAMELYPTSKQPWGRENLSKQVSRIQTKCDLLRRGHGRLEGLQDGRFQGSGIGYAGDVGVTLAVKGGKVADLQVTHKEHIEQGATRQVPAQIVERQSLQVDAITAATITLDAIVEATYRAAGKAGLR